MSDMAHEMKTELVTEFSNVPSFVAYVRVILVAC